MTLLKEFWANVPRSTYSARESTQGPEKRSTLVQLPLWTNKPQKCLGIFTFSPNYRKRIALFGCSAFDTLQKDGYSLNTFPWFHHFLAIFTWRGPCCSISPAWHPELAQAGIPSRGDTALQSRGVPKVWHCFSWDIQGSRGWEELYGCIQLKEGETKQNYVK